MFYRLRRNKYNAIRTTYNGFTYASKLEARYAMFLDSLKDKQLIDTYEKQVNYKIIIQDIKICTYRIDFVVHYSNGKTEYIDVKGKLTRESAIKIKLCEVLYNIKITLIRKIPTNIFLP